MMCLEIGETSGSLVVSRCSCCVGGCPYSTGNIFEQTTSLGVSDTVMIRANLVAKEACQQRTHCKKIAFSLILTKNGSNSRVNQR